MTVALDAIGPAVERARRAGLRPSAHEIARELHLRFADPCRRGGRSMRVLAAMSGGVDSAVAAARAVDAGHDVTGVHLALSAAPASLRHGARGCCTVEDANDARRAADVLGIPFYVWDLAERFRADVIDDFVAEYAAGRTPNPCLRCNEKIKFAAVLDRALALGFDAVVTGHHARLVDGRLTRSVDPAKDQSYVLGRARSPTSSRTRSSRSATRPRRRCARRRPARGLAVADKPDSHDICFIADGDTRGFLARQLGPRAGTIVDARPARRSAHIRARTASPSGSGAGCSWVARPPTARRATCCPSARSTTPLWSDRASCWTWTRCTPSRARVDCRPDRNRPSSSATCSCARTAW